MVHHCIQGCNIFILDWQINFVSQLGCTSRSQVLPRKIGKCVLNDFVFKLKIYSMEIQDLKTNTNLAGLLLVFNFGSDSEDFD